MLKIKITARKPAVLNLYWSTNQLTNSLSTYLPMMHKNSFKHTLLKGVLVWFHVVPVWIKRTIMLLWRLNLPGRSPVWPSVRVLPSRPPSAASSADRAPCRKPSPRSPSAGCGQPGHSDRWADLHSEGKTPARITENHINMLTPFLNTDTQITWYCRFQPAEHPSSHPPFLQACRRTYSGQQYLQI